MFNSAIGQMVEISRDYKTSKEPAYRQEQYLEDFLNLKAERERVFLGKGLVGGEYTEPVAIV